jgi:hypothetical protein
MLIDGLYDLSVRREVILFGFLCYACFIVFRINRYKIISSHFWLIEINQWHMNQIYELTYGQLNE